LNPVVTNLPNGIRLIVQPETISDTVSVYGRVKSNAKVEMAEGKDGVDQALDQLFSYGTKSLDRLAFQKALDDIGANESAGADFSLQVLTDQFERGASCWPTTNFPRRCPRTISKSSSRNWPLPSPAS
jgi:zinc protease